MRMAASALAAPRLLSRARADLIATLFTHWPRTTVSMLLGAAILTVVMWGTVSPGLFVAWLGAILANQLWRFALVRRYRATPMIDPRRWGTAWAVGSTLAGALWGCAGVVLFVPSDPGHQALLIVCLFGVILGGLNLTAVHKLSFYGFALAALLPLIVRVAAEGDQVHSFIAAVMLVVLAFILGFGHNLNNLLTQSLAMRYDNVDLIGELTAQTAAADRARKAAEAANRSKTQFLAAASHDLRQPLHAMGLFAAALVSRVRDPDARDIVTNISASVEDLERLFTALMDISQLDAGAVAPVRSTFPLATLFERLEREFAPLAASNDLRLKFVATRAHVESDPVLLERIVANLISNALRYTESGGAIVGVRRRAGSLAIVVCDTGIGVPAAERERVFEEFYQGSMPRGGRQGMGLGLAIIRRLGALLDHPIELDSIPGRGTSFSVVVPRAAPIVASPSTCGARSIASPLRGALVAVIDDEPAIVEAMRAWFVQWGAAVVGGTTAHELFAAIGVAERYPDLIIADYRLGGDALGTAVVAQLRSELGIEVPALVISGDASAATIAEMRLAALDMLLKPVLPDALLAFAERLLVDSSVGAHVRTASDTERCAIRIDSLSSAGT